MDALQERVLRWIVRLSDVFVIVLSMTLALLIHEHLLGVIPILREQAYLAHFVILCAMYVPIWISVLALTGVDCVLSELPPPSKIGWDLVRIHAISISGVVSLLWFAQLPVNRGVILLFGAINFVLLLGLRLLLVQWGRARLHHGAGRRWLIMLGDAKAIEEGKNAFTSRSLGLHALECDTDEDAHETLKRSLHELAVDRIIFLPPFDGLRRAERLLELCENQGIPAMIPHIVRRNAGRNVELVSFFGVPGMSLSRKLPPTLGLAVKQLLDTLGTAIGLVLTSPLLLIVSLLIMMGDGRPVFFSQERVGLNGRRFRMLKFRTMVKNAEALKDALQFQNEAGGPVFKMTRDPRVTRLGYFLRRTSIDELPQLLNVLTGDMSLVGPRPLPVAEQQQIHGAQRRRLAMKPGITGLWQVSGRSNITFDDWMNLDLKYIDDWSFWLDMKILARTVPTVLFGKGAR